MNNPVPSDKSFYNNVDGNAPFSVDEETLRAAIYIPPGFTWGKKQPIVLSPGTGGYGYSQFASNIGKLLATTDYADPIYLNIPGALLADAQVNAEYVAYALQYFNVMTSRKPAIVTWSQGSLDTQWAFSSYSFPLVPQFSTNSHSQNTGHPSLVSSQTISLCHQITMEQFWPIFSVPGLKLETISLVSPPSFNKFTNPILSTNSAPTTVIRLTSPLQTFIPSPMRSYNHKSELRHPLS